jgi:hypothetical protein
MASRITRSCRGCLAKEPSIGAPKSARGAGFLRDFFGASGFFVPVPLFTILFRAVDHFEVADLTATDFELADLLAESEFELADFLAGFPAAIDFDSAFIVAFTDNRQLTDLPTTRAGYTYIELEMAEGCHYCRRRTNRGLEERSSGRNSALHSVDNLQCRTG